MIEPKDFKSELERLQEVESYQILDTASEEDYDYLTSIAAEICDTPISLITFLDDKRNWFKSHHGADVQESPKNLSFCGHAINAPENLFQVEDLRKDNRFFDNPLVTGDSQIIFYAGMPLVNENGYPLGTLCVMDHKPKKLTVKQENALKSLSKQVLNLLKLRRANLVNEKLLKQFSETNKALEKFAYIAAHDIKSPLNNITGILEHVQQQNKVELTTNTFEYIEIALKSSKKLGQLVEGLLEHSRNSNAVFDTKEEIDIKKHIVDLQSLLNDNNSLKIKVNSDLLEIKMNKTALDQILINLITNSIKYSDKETVEVTINLSEDLTKYHFEVKDNGPGIDPKYHEQMFKMFETVKANDKYGKQGNGIGLATIKTLVENLGGTIEVKSELDKGAQFNFSISK